MPAGTGRRRAAALRAKRDFEFQGHRLRAGRWLVLDLYGTNRDPRTWEEPEAFRPERFAGRDGDAPQDVRVALWRLPALPRSGFVIRPAA